MYTYIYVYDIKSSKNEEKMYIRKKKETRLYNALGMEVIFLILFCYISGMFCVVQFQNLEIKYFSAHEA